MLVPVRPLQFTSVSYKAQFLKVAVDLQLISLLSGYGSGLDIPFGLCLANAVILKGVKLA